MRSHHIALLIFSLTTVSRGDTIIEDFSTLTHFSARGTTGVWNAALQKLQVAPVVDNDLGSFNESHAIDFGRGTDGPFNAATMYSFDVNQGAVASTVTLSTSRAYDFTTFTLPTNVTLKAVGGSPLILRVQGNVTLNGRINLRGSSGGPPTDNGADQPSGGSGAGGGGGAGGRGGSAAANGAAGSLASGATAGGAGGGGNGDGTAAGGAGGGGAYGADGNVGDSGTGSGGTAGTHYGDTFPNETAAPGGSGGGGAGGSVGSFDYPSGGGGGGGGGAIVLTAGGNILINSTGSILAYGGDGGVADDTDANCSSGGGGAGGTIALFSGKAITNNGTVNARGGVGGGGECHTQGGDGGEGRVRFCDSTTDPTQSGSPAVEFPSPLNGASPYGQVFSTLSSVTIFSTAYDTQNTGPLYTSVDVVANQPSGSTVDVAVAGSSDNFASDNTGFVSLTSLSALSAKRYIRFRVTLQAADESDPPSVSKITINYTPRLQSEFNIKQGSCAAIHSGQEGSEGAKWAALGWLALLAYLLLLPPVWRRIQSSISRAGWR